MKAKTMTILKTEAITVKHSTTAPVLTFPDLTVNAEDKILLLGDSGCGKTSLLSVIAGLLQPTSGKVFIQGKDIYKMGARERDDLRGKKFGFVFQTLHLLPSLTIAQNILLAADMVGIVPPADRLKNLLLSLGLSDKADSKPTELSQGQQQRAALARAIFNFPALIIADEPTSSLDDRNAMIVMDLLEQQAKESGSALLVATHDHRIKNRFDRVINLSSVSQKEVA
jgi:putative ABC transport system ATP-binding protein